jgi:hypothetical protein
LRHWLVNLVVHCSHDLSYNLFVRPNVSVRGGVALDVELIDDDDGMLGRELKGNSASSASSSLW